MPRTIRTQDESYQRQPVPKTNRAQDNSYPSRIVTRLVPKKTRTQEKSHPGKLLPFWLASCITKYIVVHFSSYYAYLWLNFVIICGHKLVTKSSWLEVVILCATHVNYVLKSQLRVFQKRVIMYKQENVIKVFNRNHGCFEKPNKLYM